MLLPDIKNIFAGSTPVTEIYKGRNLVWAYDPYPSVTWPKFDGMQTYMPYGLRYGSIEHQKVAFFIPRTGNISVSANTYNEDCEGEGGGLSEGAIAGTAGYVAYRDRLLDNWTLTGNTSEPVWLTYVDDYETSINGTNAFSLGCRAMLVKEQDTYPEEACDHSLSFGSAVTQYFGSLEMVGILDPDGNTTYLWDGRTRPSFTAEHMNKLTSLKYFFTQDTNFPIPLYLAGSTNWTIGSLRFTVKYSPGATFQVMDNSYWRGLIPWEMLSYYHVTFTDPDGNIIEQ